MTPGDEGSSHESADVAPRQAEEVPDIADEAEDTQKSPVIQALSEFEDADMGLEGEFEPADTASEAEGSHETEKQATPGKRKRTRRTAHTKDDARVKEQRSKHRWKIVRNVLIVSVAAIVIGAICAFSIFRWGICDDASDIEGVWRIEGSDSTIAISDGKFVLTDEIGYSYDIDPMSKTLSFSFGKLSGNARYRFSSDRNMLSIEDGDFNGFSNMLEDIPWTFGLMADSISGAEPSDPKLSDDSMTLVRVD